MIAQTAALQIHQHQRSCLSCDWLELIGLEKTGVEAVIVSCGVRNCGFIGQMCFFIFILFYEAPQVNNTHNGL